MSWQGFKSWLRHDPDQTIGLVSAVAAVILAILTMSGFALTSWVLAATAATLIALLSGNVRDRLNARSTATETHRMADAVADLSLAVRHMTRTVYKDQDEPYEQVREYISHNEVRKAVFLQYSGTKCSREIDAVLRKGGTEVVVYLQDQEKASELGSDYQAGLIRTSIETLQGWRRKYEGISELTVYQCEVPLSARAVMVDDRLLCMGWYICGPGSIKHPNDRMDVSGHDMATVIAYRGTENFDALDKTFRHALGRLERGRRQVDLLSKRLPAK